MGANQMLEISYENGTFTTNAYDAANQLETTAHFTSAPRRNGEPADEIDPAFATPDAPNLRVFAAHSYELDVLGRRTKQTFANGRYDAYRYDATGQVVGADYALRPNGNAGQRSRTQQFNYDAMGNRLSFIDSGAETRYTPNNVNQHIRRHVGWAGEYRRCSGEAQDARAGVSCQYTDISAATSPPDGGWRYDARGNLRSDGSRRFRWDGEDRLIRADVPNAAEGKQRVDYTYDSKSRRMIRKQGREHTLYIYDKWNCIAEYRVTGRNADSVLTTRYVWGTDLSSSLQGAGGVGGLLHADEVTNGRGQTKGYYFHYDGNGNVTAVTNAKGRRAASYTYDAFGNTLEAKGNYADQNSYRFSTKPLDEVTGFYYYGYRYYDPVTGRWPDRDPIQEQGGVNIYGMVGNDPVGRFDLLGKIEVWNYGFAKVTQEWNFHDSITELRQAIGESEWYGSTGATIETTKPGIENAPNQGGKCCVRIDGVGETIVAITTDLSTSTSGAPQLTARGLSEVAKHEDRRSLYLTYGGAIYQDLHEHYDSQIGKTVCRDKRKDAITALQDWIDTSFQAAAEEFNAYEARESEKVDQEIWEGVIQSVPIYGAGGTIVGANNHYYADHVLRNISEVSHWIGSIQYPAFPQ